MRSKISKEPIDRLKESYDLLIEMMENPQKCGWIALLNKLKPESKEPINLKLFDFKEEIDIQLNYLASKILRKIGLDNLPNERK